ncbi:MAG: zf-HC2 domain-containing protein, partial [Chloroflexi bacterium]|nr:zf-HC2 domain-containing protein [Chloroflexota bacterium]
MNCEQTEELLAAYRLAALADDEAAAVRAHLTSCRRHDASLAELQSVAERLLLAADDVELPAALRSRLLDAFNAAVAAESKVTPLSPRPRSAMQARFAYLAAAAVLVLAVVGLSVWNVILQTGDDDGRATVVAQLTGEAGSGQVVYLQDQQLAVLTLDLPELPGDRT